MKIYLKDKNIQTKNMNSQLMEIFLKDENIHEGYKYLEGKYKYLMDVNK